MPLFRSSLRLALLALAIASLWSCNKENVIDNNRVLQTPYALFASDRQGALYNTSFADSAYKTIFSPDGRGIRSIAVSGQNILFVKTNTHYSANNGIDFNFSDYTVNKTAEWSSIMLAVPSQNRVYIGIDSVRGFGVKYSEDNGVHWQVDTLYQIDTNIKPVVQARDVRITSFAQLKSGVVFAHDRYRRHLYFRGATGQPWKQIRTDSLPILGTYYLSSFNNELLMADYTTGYGLYHSSDSGHTWTQYRNLPNLGVKSVGTPNGGEHLFVGVQGGGVYRYDNGFFFERNFGVGNGTTPTGFVAKQTRYKNDEVIKYYFMSSTTGIYRSLDEGRNWVKVREGDYTAIY